MGNSSSSRQEADAGKARAAWYPTVGLSATDGENLSNYNFNTFPAATIAIPEYAAHLIMQVDLFTGLRRLNDVLQAAGQYDGACARVESFEVDIQTIHGP